MKGYEELPTEIALTLALAVVPWLLSVDEGDSPPSSNTLRAKEQRQASPCFAAATAGGEAFHFAEPPPDIFPGPASFPQARTQITPMFTQKPTFL